MTSHTTASATDASRAATLLELPREESLRLLAAHGIGRVVVATSAGRPVIRPVNYVFDPVTQSVVFRTSPGSKLYALRHRRHASFEIDGVDEGPRAAWSVIVSGVTSEITDARELRRLAGLGLSSWAPGPMPHVVRIRAWTVSGRRVQPQLPPPERAAP